MNARTVPGILGIGLLLVATAADATLVGTSTGTLAVSATGAATYSMPLTVPPGLHAFAPTLSLEYNSNGGDSLMGPGWTLGGLSQITRCPSTYAQNGVTDAVTLGGNDRFCLDGQMLKTSSTYGSVGAQYRTEVETFNYITSNSGSQGNPSYFTVVDKSGTARVYGQTYRVTRTVNGTAYGYIWLLDSATDTSGNTIQYAYSISNGEYEPTSISYVQNNSAGITAAHATLSFTYGSRTGYEPVGYLDGLVFNHTQLLTRIDTKVDSTAVRHWKLGYTNEAQGPSKGRDVLTSVTECTGSDETACLTPMQFKWQFGGNSYTSSTLNYPSPPLTTSKIFQPYWTDAVEDVDGDGKADYIAVTENATGGLAAYVAPAGDGTQAWQSTFGAGLLDKYGVGYTNFAIGDVDGDGRTDIVSVNPNAASGATAATVQAALSTGHSFVASSTAKITLTTSDIWGQPYVIDVNGDGLGDVLMVSSEKVQVITTTQGSNGLALSKGSVQCCFGDDVYSASGNLTQPYGTRPLDLNGDGAPDLIVYGFDYNQTFRVETYLSNGKGAFSTTKSFFGILGPMQASLARVLFADVNGDGNDDVIVTMENENTHGYVYTWLSKGDGTFDGGHHSTITVSTACKPAVSANSYCETVAGDFNGDGLADVAFGDGSMASSNGDGTFSQGAVLGIPRNIGTTYGVGPYIVGDLNGDGVDDVAGPAPALNTVAALGFSSADPTLRIQTVTDGFGATATVTYEPLTNTATYTPPTYGQNIFPSVPEAKPLYVVTSVSRTNPNHSNRVQTYSYSGGLSDLQGRGFLGFDTVTSQEPTPAGIVFAQTRYNLTFPYDGTVYDSASYVDSISTSNLLSDKQTTMQSAKSSMGSYFVYPHEVITKDYEIAPGTPGVYMSSETVNTYDTVYGNLTGSTETDYSGDIGVTPSFVKTFANDYSASCLSGGNQQMGLICQEQVTRSGTNTPAITRTTRFGYDTTNLLKEVKLEPTDSTHWQDSAFQRDGFGNIKLTTISGPDITTRSASDTYSTAAPYYGRFDTSLCDALSNCHTLTFDGGTGNVLTNKDPNGITTAFSYDALGRQASLTINQSGINSYDKTYYYWCSQYPTYCNSVASALYVEYDTESTGVQHVTAYDALSREVREASTLGDGSWTETLTDYDSIGRVSKISSPRLAAATQTYWTTKSYDALDRLTQIVAPQDQNHTTASITKYGFDGLTSTLTDPNTHTTTTVRDPLGNITSVADASTNSVTYQYDAFQNLTQVTDNNNHTTSIHYNIRGYRTEVVDPDMGDWIFTPDAIGEVLSVKDAKLQTTTLKYDVLGRLINQAAPDYITKWTYDTLWKGALTEADKNQTSSGTLAYKRSYTYWPSGGVKTDSQVINGATYTTSYTYDTNLRKSQITYPDSFAVAIQYSAYGAPNLVYQPGNTGAYYWQVEPGASWDEWGDVYLQKYGNGIETLINRDSAVGSVDSIMAGPTAGSNNTVQNLTYGWDKAWNITSRADAIQANLQETFGYDTVNRLTSIAPSSNSLGVSSMSLKYDTHGNISTKSNMGTYGYGTSAHAVATAGSTSYQYDENGNMKSVGTTARTYQWSSDNMPISLSAGSASATFGYGDDKDRVSETITQGGSTSTVAYLADGLEEVWKTASGTTTYDYIVGSAGIIGVLIRDGVHADTIEYIHPDALGSASVVTASNGAVSQRLVYDGFGQRHITAGSSSYLTTKGFTGHLQLDPLNLIHMNGRVYDPAVGRFLSPDPIVQYPYSPQGWDRYGYVLGNTLSATDPSGFDGQVQNPANSPIPLGTAATMGDTASQLQSTLSNAGASSSATVEKLKPVNVRGSRVGVQDLGGGFETTITTKMLFGERFQVIQRDPQGSFAKSADQAAMSGNGAASKTGANGNGRAPSAPSSGDGDTTSGGPGKAGNSEPDQVRQLKEVDVTADRIESCIDCWPLPGPEKLVLGAKFVGTLGTVVVRGVKSQIHHIATNKAIKSGFTALFERIFSKGGMTLEDAANKMLVAGHAGRHSPAYHKYVLARLQAATEGLTGQEYQAALKQQLDTLGKEIQAHPEMLNGEGLPK